MWGTTGLYSRSNFVQHFCVTCFLVLDTIHFKTENSYDTTPFVAKNNVKVVLSAFQEVDEYFLFGFSITK